MMMGVISDPFAGSTTTAIPPSKGAPAITLRDWSITPSRANFGAWMPAAEARPPRSISASNTVGSFSRRAT